MSTQKLSHIFTKIGFKALQAKQPHILLSLILLLCVSINYAQDTPARKSLKIAANKDSINTELPFIKKDSLTSFNIVQDSIKKDSVKKEPALLLDKIKYKAKDYVRISQKNKQIYLYNEAEVYYQDTELKAGVIVIDYEKNEVYAGRIKDSTGNLIQNPYFKQGSNEVKPDSIRFNYTTEKALIWKSRSEQAAGGFGGVTSGGNILVFAELTKKESDSVYYLKEGKLTTDEDLDNPDYYIRIRKGKFVPKKKVIAGFSNMYIADIPTPIAVPFAYFPLSESRTSGVIFPTFGQVNERGFFLQDLGYYFAVSDYFDLAIKGDYYTNGSFGFRAETSYAVRYRFQGRLNFNYENVLQSQRGFPDFSQQRVFNLQWSHTQDQKASPNSRFSASVNLGSSSFFRQSLNQLNSSNFLQNTLNSSVSYSKTFPAYPSVNINLTATHSQNTNTEQINMTLPTLQGSVERIFPFAPKEGIKKGIFQNINFQYNIRAENRIQTTDSLFLKKEMFEDARIGFRHTIPISTNFKVAKYLSVTLNGNYEDIWTFRTIQRRDFDETTNEVPIDTINGFDRFNQYNFGGSLGTTIYGTFNFKEGSKIQAIRHTMRPSISYGFTPSGDRYFEEYVANETGEIREFTRFEGGLFGSPRLGNSNNIGISISNTLEAKVTPKDSTATEPKKVMILNSLNFNTGYNIAADSLPWSPLRVTGGTQILNSKMSINFGATLDPYAIDNNGRRIDVFNVNNGGSLFRLTNANLTLNYALSNKTFEKKDDDEEKDDRSVEEQVADQFFQDGFAFGENRRNGYNEEEKEEKEEGPQKLYGARIPWNLRIGYSMNYNNSNRQNEVTNNALQFSGDVSLATRWKVRFSSSYDFVRKGFGFTNLGFQRDLNTWNMSFDWQPFRQGGTWYFFIGIKGSILKDVKWEKRRDPDRRL
ncbi:putative LPS assembly protein LptD [Ascidiimonas sp. W6]|uniref:putative LPS assembly protein LptD n=1 Tax=Ascidiimonas meishanensis TaxID=3128903 RepID=UPI0030EB76A9